MLKIIERSFVNMTDFARTQKYDNSPFLGYGFFSGKKKGLYLAVDGN